VLESALADETSALADAVRQMGAIHLERIARLTETIERLAAGLETASRTDPALRRLRAIPGIGPVIAGAVAAFAPGPDLFDGGRNFAASCAKHASGVTLGLVPRQRSTGGKVKPGSVEPGSAGPTSAGCRSSGP
jgi:transposase